MTLYCIIINSVHAFNIFTTKFPDLRYYVTCKGPSSCGNKDIIHFVHVYLWTAYGLM